jgi:DNA polymerase III subunit delta
MKIKSQQLTQYLSEAIAPLYLISGDEFLLVQEAVDSVRQYAMKAGYSGREVFYLESGFNWDNFLVRINNYSLFAERTLLELHLKSKLSEVGSKILQEYTKKIIPDKIILIIADKLDAAQQKTLWFKAIDSCGIVVQVWPIEIAQFPGWINKRLQQAGFKVDVQGIQILVDHTAGNLLAAAQEIEKLKLLYRGGVISVEQIIAVIADNARFNVFNLLDACFLGKKAEVIRILDNLQAEGVEAAIILWAIVRELRVLININFIVAQKKYSLDQAIAASNVWHNRKVLVKQVLSRHDLGSLERILKNAAEIDYLLKGGNKQHVLWHELVKIYLDLAE